MLYAPHASAVTVCLFSTDREETARFTLNREPNGTWTGFVPGVHEGQMYGYRVDGRWSPKNGLLHNPAKVLLDPYARSIVPAIMDDSLFTPGFDDGIELEADTRDSAKYAAIGVVAKPLSHAQRVFTDWRDTVIYEAHVKGFTMLNPAIPEELRGTYAGLAHPAAIAYLKELGITAIELLPIHANLIEPFLWKRGLRNYWGYSTLSYYAPEPSYATQAARDAGPLAVRTEVQEMVAALHNAGIEVILDVVYNHTCEGPTEGPTVSWRGIDNTSYYFLGNDNPACFVDHTGCGNTMDFRRDAVINLALDSLRYWVEEIGVDGFRFDLAVSLGRNGDRFDPRHPFLVGLTSDPVLRTCKLINEPWDLGPNGWRTGQFPAPSADWNDHFRNTMRDFWVSAPRSFAHGGGAADLRDFATRLAGSADLFGHGRIPGGRGATATINMVTAHDGFTMRDLVSYNTKHNEANLENNRDGSDNNQSWNFGHEGEGASEQIEIARRKAQRNLLGTLILSAGTPMLTAGDEFGRSQGGNNNAYCQDNPISWVSWKHHSWQSDLQATTAYLLRMRRTIDTLRPTAFYTESSRGGDELLDLQWFDVSGYPMPQYRWFDPGHRTLQMLRSGCGSSRDVLIVFNGAPSQRELRLPRGRGDGYELAWDSTWERPKARLERYAPQALVTMDAFSMRVYLGGE